VIGRCASRWDARTLRARSMCWAADGRGGMGRCTTPGLRGWNGLFLKARSPLADSEAAVEAAVARGRAFWRGWEQSGNRDRYAT